MSARALQCAQEIQVISEVVEDAEAVRAVESFLGEQGTRTGTVEGCDKDTHSA